MHNFKLKGSKNIRDLGGIPVATGLVKEGLLLRGGHLQKVTKRDIRFLKDTVGIKTIIDLRTDRERANKPDVIMEGVEYLHYPMFNSQIDGISYERPKEKIPKPSQIPDLVGLYPALVSDDCLVNLKKVIHKILSMDKPQFPLLFHCTEGKDRTGIISMVLLSVLGASKDEIMTDYLLTNSVAERRSWRYYRLIKYLLFDVKSAEKLRHVFLAEEKYLNATFEAIEKRCSSISEFLDKELEITPAEREKFKALCIE